MNPEILKRAISKHKYQLRNKRQFAVYEIEPSHGSEPHGLIMGPYNSKKEATEAMNTYYNTPNYYVKAIKSIK